MNRKIVILGVTGNIGSRIAQLLLQKGHQVTGVARHAHRAHELGLDNVTFRAGELTDTSFLTEVLRGQDAAFVLIPPHMVAPDYLAYQETVGKSIAEAIRNSDIRHIVNLSSHGAHLPAGTGPVAGLYHQEQRLNQLPGVHLVHLRPAYFFENVLANIPMIEGMGINGSAIQPDLAFPAIATADIADVAAQYLDQLNFSGVTVRELLGPRDVTMQEMTAILGRALGKPNLPYIQFSYEDANRGMQQAGLSQSMADLYTEFSRSFNDRSYFAGAAPRDAQSTTPTTFEAFVASAVQKGAPAQAV